MRKAIMATGIVALAVPAALLAQDAPSLGTLADQVEFALVTGDAGGLPRADGFRYTENGQTLQTADGMWGTLSAVTGTDPEEFPAAASLDYRIELTEGDEIVRLVETDENSSKGVAAIRIRADGGKISDIEVVPVREEFGGARGGTVTLLQPAMLVTMDDEKVAPADPIFTRKAAKPMARDALVGVAQAYLGAIVSNDPGGVSFAADCRRNDNGVLATNSPDAFALDPDQPGYKPFALGCGEQIASGFYTNIQRMRGLRSWADPAHGVVISFVQFDNPGTVMAFQVPGVGTVNYPGPKPIRADGGTSVSQQFNGGISANMTSPVSMNCVFVFKIEDGRIRRIDAFYRGAQYGFSSGW